jgi:hypothetical protein
MSTAASKQNGKRARRGYVKHGDSYRQRLLKEQGVAAIDGRSQTGKPAKTWRSFALERKGKTCPPDVLEMIDVGTFYMWRSRELRSFIVADQKKRGSLLNKRTREYPAVNDKHDELYKEWQKINTDLQLNKRLPFFREALARPAPNGATR